MEELSKAQRVYLKLTDAELAQRASEMNEAETINETKRNMLKQAAKQAKQVKPEQGPKLIPVQPVGTRAGTNNKKISTTDRDIKWDA